MCYVSIGKTLGRDVSFDGHNLVLLIVNQKHYTGCKPNSRKTELSKQKLEHRMKWKRHTLRNAPDDTLRVINTTTDLLFIASCCECGALSTSEHSIRHPDHRLCRKHARQLFANEQSGKSYTVVAPSTDNKVTPVTSHDTKRCCKRKRKHKHITPTAAKRRQRTSRKATVLSILTGAVDVSETEVNVRPHVDATSHDMPLEATHSTEPAIPDPITPTRGDAKKRHDAAADTAKGANAYSVPYSMHKAHTATPRKTPSPRYAYTDTTGPRPILPYHTIIAMPTMPVSHATEEPATSLITMPMSHATEEPATSLVQYGVPIVGQGSTASDLYHTYDTYHNTYHNTGVLPPTQPHVATATMPLCHTIRQPGGLEPTSARGGVPEQRKNGGAGDTVIENTCIEEDLHTDWIFVPAVDVSDSVGQGFHDLSYTLSPLIKL